MSKQAINANQGAVEQMFNRIAKKYDFLNHFLSFGIDKIWRRKLVKEIKKHNPESVLDIATGTGDMLLLMQKKGIKKTDGVDPSEGMLNIAKEKVNKKFPNRDINLKISFAEKMDIDNSYYDAAVIVFGIRNFENIDKALSEIKRILKNKGHIYVLEFSLPKNRLIKHLYLFYLKYFIPVWGKLISREKTAYSYLAETIQEFSKNINIAERLNENGFNTEKIIPLSSGVARIWIANKP